MFSFSSRRRHTRSLRDWSSDVCSSDLRIVAADDLALSRLRMLEISVADESARFCHGLFRNTGHLGDARIKILGGLALQRRSGQRRQIVRERKALRFSERLLTEGALSFELRRCERGQLQRCTQCETIEI